MNESTEDRLKEILNVIVSFAQLDFRQEVKTSDKGDEIDALGTGVNMLGEELNARLLSLQEKETMLMEIHHRVKNNLQIVSSLLNLQVENTANEELKTFARESQSRIKTIALIHEMLYNSTDFKYTNFKNYVSRLIRIHQDIYSLDGQIQYELTISEDMYFNIDTLIPIGLIINEAISNSVRYAFPDGKGMIELKGEQDDKICLIIIQDNGIGIKDGFDKEKVSGLGMNLIQILSKQLDAEVKMNNQNGFGYELRFNVQEN